MSERVRPTFKGITIKKKRNSQNTAENDKEMTKML